MIPVKKRGRKSLVDFSARDGRMPGNTYTESPTPLNVGKKARRRTRPGRM